MKAKPLPISSGALNAARIGAPSFINTVTYKGRPYCRWLDDAAALLHYVRSSSRVRALDTYWTYLLSIEAAPEEERVFEKLSVPKPGKNGKADERVPFTPDEVAKLLKAAHADNDEELASLIDLARYTGARIEELCALPIDRVGKDYIEIADAKTAAGWRQVPIHSKLKRTVARLVGQRKDGYLLAGLVPNKYGDRSNAIGKRFGRLKTALGFGSLPLNPQDRGNDAGERCSA